MSTKIFHVKKDDEGKIIIVFDIPQKEISSSDWDLIKRLMGIKITPKKKNTKRKK
jgi:hypothetical protein